MYDPEYEEAASFPSEPYPEDEEHDACVQELRELRGAVREAEHKLAILAAIRRLLEERGGEGELFALFSALLDQAAEIRAEADQLSDRIALLEDELSEAKWEAENAAACRNG